MITIGKALGHGLPISAALFVRAGARARLGARPGGRAHAHARAQSFACAAAHVVLDEVPGLLDRVREAGERFGGLGRARPDALAAGRLAGGLAPRRPRHPGRRGRLADLGDAAADDQRRGAGRGPRTNQPGLTSGSDPLEGFSRLEVSHGTEVDASARCRTRSILAEAVNPRPPSTGSDPAVRRGPGCGARPRFRHSSRARGRRRVAPALRPVDLRRLRATRRASWSSTSRRHRARPGPRPRSGTAERARGSGVRASGSSRQPLGALDRLVHVGDRPVFPATDAVAEDPGEPSGCARCQRPRKATTPCASASAGRGAISITQRAPSLRSPRARSGRDRGGGRSHQGDHRFVNATVRVAPSGRPRRAGASTDRRLRPCGQRRLRGRAPHRDELPTRG